MAGDAQLPQLDVALQLLAADIPEKNGAMDLQAACRTYNILMMEGRKVAASQKAGYTVLNLRRFAHNDRVKLIQQLSDAVVRVACGGCVGLHGRSLVRCVALWIAGLFCDRWVFRARQCRFGPTRQRHHAQAQGQQHSAARQVPRKSSTADDQQGQQGTDRDGVDMPRPEATGLAAAELGRRYVGIDLNRDYLDLSLRTRLVQPSLTTEAGAADA